MCYYSPCPSFPSLMNSSCCPQYPPCPPPSPNSLCGISKLANFVHYGGGGESDPHCPQPTPQNCRPKCPPQRDSYNKPPQQRRCPPLPPCAPTCIVPDCKDMPAQRLRNVDVLEELCYYVPGGDPGCPMDCYSVDCCGNVEKISEGSCCDPCDPCCGSSSQPPNPVKYSRRQRFTFNDPQGGRPSYGDPWPFEGSCGDGGSNGRNGAGGRNGNRRGSLCDDKSKSNDPNYNSCCGGRKYTYCPEDFADECTEMLPPESGVYYFDKERRAFVPEKDLPKPPEVIEKEVRVPDVEEYELLEEETGSGGGGGRGGTASQDRPVIQPVVQPIIMPGTNGGSCPPPPCPPCVPPFTMAPPPCLPPSYGPPPPLNQGAPPPQPCNLPCRPCCCNPNPCCNPCNFSCNPCCNPCMPCGPMNPFMNMCGGVLPMVIPMCPQQPAGGGGFGGPPLPPPGMPPPPPFPFPPPFFQKETKKKNKKKKTHTKSTESSYSYEEDDTEESPQYSDNIVVPGAPEALLKQMGEDVPSDAYTVDVGDTIDVYDGNGSGNPMGPSGGRGRNPGMGPGGGGRGRNPGMGPGGRGRNGRNSMDSGGIGNNKRTVQTMGDGTVVTTIDFPPGEADAVAVKATNRANPKQPNVDVVAELQGGRAVRKSPPGQMMNPTSEYTADDGSAVQSYKLPPGKDGYVKATSGTKLKP